MNAYFMIIMIVMAGAMVVSLHNIGIHLASIYKVQSANFGRLLEQDNKAEEAKKQEGKI